jgi:hypothetical protein
MGYRIIYLSWPGCNRRHQTNGKVLCVDDPIWRGFLANNERTRSFEQTFAAHLPGANNGQRNFSHATLARRDAVTRIDPARKLRVCAFRRRIRSMRIFGVRSYCGIARRAADVSAAINCLAS